MEKLMLKFYFRIIKISVALILLKVLMAFILSIMMGENLLIYFGEGVIVSTFEVVFTVVTCFLFYYSVIKLSRIKNVG